MRFGLGYFGDARLEKGGSGCCGVWLSVAGPVFGSGAWEETAPERSVSRAF